jgi:hypothetical protein
MTLYWGLAAAALAGYTGAFLLARRPVSLRASTIARGVLLFAALRLGLAFLRPPGAWDVLVLIAALLALSALAAPAHLWLVRSTAGELAERVQEGSCGLLLSAQELRPGILQFSVGGRASQVRWRPFGRRIQLLVLPRARAGKLRLLVNWLGKQYPGPLPAVRIHILRTGAASADAPGRS